MTRDEEIDAIIDGIIDTVAFRAFWVDTPIQKACRDIIKARGGADAERSNHLADLERREAEGRERLAKAKWWGK